MSSRVASEVPRMFELTSSMGDSMPRRRLMLTTLWAPMAIESWAKTVLIDRRVASTSVNQSGAGSSSPSATSGRLWPVAPPPTCQMLFSSVAPRISNSISFGAGYMAVTFHPASIAAARPMGFIAEPAWRPLPTARLTLASSSSSKKSRPPTMARMWPFCGSMTTTEASGCPWPAGRCSSTAASAAAWSPRSMVVSMRRPPSNSSSSRWPRVTPKASLSRNQRRTSSTKWPAG